MLDYREGELIKEKWLEKFFPGVNAEDLIKG